MMISFILVYALCASLSLLVGSLMCIWAEQNYFPREFMLRNDLTEWNVLSAYALLWPISLPLTFLGVVAYTLYSAYKILKAVIYLLKKDK